MSTREVRIVDRVADAFAGAVADQRFEAAEQYAIIAFAVYATAEPTEPPPATART